MNKTLLTAAAVLTIVSPLFSLPVLAQQGRDDGPRPPQAQQANDRSDQDHHDNRTEWRDTRSDAHWDETQHNGYYVKERWHAGPPPASAYRQTGFALAYKPWAKGDHLGYYGSRYTAVDYRSAHLTPPRRGYHWVRDDRGTYLLAAVSSGLIASVVLNQDR